jgi:hypothetical protein
MVANGAPSQEIMPKLGFALVHFVYFCFAASRLCYSSVSTTIIYLI